MVSYHIKRYSVINV